MPPLNYADAKHRAHAIHMGEVPTTRITRGPESLVVTLDNWPVIEENLFPSLYDSLVANWGEAPSRSVFQPCRYERLPYADAIGHMQSADHKTGWCRLEDDQQAYVEACFAGKTLQQALERFTFTFCVDGCTRAETHQIVRTRVGAGFMQHGGRDNDWRHRAWTMPETMARACDADNAKRGADRMPMEGDFTKLDPPSNPYPKSINGRVVCVSDWGPIERYLAQHEFAPDLQTAIESYLGEGKALYATLVDAGIPWQDARRLLWMGTQTYIHCDYNYVALKGVLGNRLEHVMDYEVNAVAQLMLREVHMKCPTVFAKYLGSHSDAKKQAAFAGLESWPPDGKWPNPYERCAICKGDRSWCDMQNTCIAAGTMTVVEPRADNTYSVDQTPHPAHRYTPYDTLPRQHSSAQMPFWVLTPAAMLGGPVEWIPTNGVYPWDEVNRRTAEVK